MGRRKKDKSHSSHRQGAPDPVRSLKLKDMIDQCIYCGNPVLWEEAIELPGGLLAHPECRNGDSARKSRGAGLAVQLLKDGKELDDLLQ